MKENTKQIINELKENKWLHYIILIAIGITLSIPLMHIQIRDTHDGFLHLLRLIGTVDSLKIGQIPPIVIPNYCNGAGYAMNLFYPPLVTYLPLAMKLFSNTYSTTLKIYGAIAIILSGFTMYKFTYQVTKKRSIAFFSALFYLIAPYKLANVYKRFAIGEFTALVFLPLVFLGLYNLFEQNKEKHYYIAIGAIGLMLSHTVTTLYTALFCALYVILNIKRLKEKEIIKKCAINAAFILLISMAFWLPLLEATTSANYTIMNDSLMRTNGSFSASNTISFSQLLKDKGEEDGTTFLIGIPTILAIMLTPFAIKKVDTKYKSFYLLNIIFSMISLFMTSRFFPWKIMPNIICKLQYPWRMIGYFNFFISIVCGINVYITLKNIVKKDIIRAMSVIFFVIISITSSIKIESQFFTKNENVDKEYEQYIFENKRISHKAVNRDYMPVKALYLQDTYVKEREDVTYILSGEAKIENEVKESLNDEMKLLYAEEGTELEFSYYYYPGYEIVLNANNENVKLKAQESINGYVSCIVPKFVENGEVSISYRGTAITHFSYIASAVFAIMFVLYIGLKNVVIYR